MPTVLNSRQRVRCALGHCEPDRAPIDIGGSTATTLVQRPYERLRAALGLTGITQFMKRRSQTVLLDEAIALRLGSDTRPLLVGSPDAFQDRYQADGSIEDEFGVLWRCTEGGHYVAVRNPLRAGDLAGLARFPWPDPYDPGRTRGLRAKARRLHEETPYAIVLSLPVGFVHLSQYLRGFSQYLMDLVLEPQFAESLMDAALEWWLALAGTVLEEVGPYVDVVQFGDDVAFQDRPLVDLGRYRRWFKPRHRKMIDLIKRHSSAKVLYHCCGAVADLIPEFIDIGVDALNPVQVSAAGMETPVLKVQFGRDIAFWGAIDTQHVLPFGSPDDVRAEVRRRIADLAPGGGYILAAVHNIQADVPPENILAMAGAAAEG